MEDGYSLRDTRRLLHVVRDDDDRAVLAQLVDQLFELRGGIFRSRAVLDADTTAVRAVTRLDRSQSLTELRATAVQLGVACATAAAFAAVS